ncbi:FxLYD domain-containing protein [Salinilacihabitans rarus]|uniref:FxLYD domain-containing protein n=1 Tax=Salinilacihabitans rarus TaxID=2961596 RepID=UPI0020C9012C|nr:FxLYD domain-containing protein [Salinilacihabitans rarus]
MSDAGTGRRRYLAALCGAVATVAGCGAAETAPRYESGEADGNASANGSRSAEQLETAEALAVTEADEDADHREGLAVVDHEYVVYDDYRGPTVEGVVENDGDEPLRRVEARVRVYDDAGHQLGRYVDRTGDLEPGDTWRFEVLVLESPGDVASYDVAVVGL